MGEYYYGDGLGLNITLHLKANRTFDYGWAGCLGLYDENHGRVEVLGDVLRLRPKLPVDDSGFGGLPTEVYVVPWGERTYLVPTDRVASFCNAVNSGEEPRDGVHGSQLLRHGDYEKPAPGRPALPEQYRGCLLERDVEATVTAVEASHTEPGLADTTFWKTPVTLNVGRADGVYEGMELYVIDPDLVETAEVTEVGEHDSRALFTQYEDFGTLPQVGWRLSTRPPWR